MVQRRLFQEECHPFFKNVAGVENDAFGALSCLEIIFKVSAELK